MSWFPRKRFDPHVADLLEDRRLLAAPVVAGNLGQILHSQFQPYGFRTTVGTQFEKIRVGGSVRNTLTSNIASRPAETSATPVNLGLIHQSQLNGGGFETVGLQFQRVQLGGGLHVHGSDLEETGSTTSNSVAAAGGIFSGLTTLVNKGLINQSQVNDGGFGVVDRAADGKIIAREGRVGLQWRDTRVKGPVDLGLDDLIIQPGSTASTVAAAAAPGTTVFDPTTNTGRIRDSQFNDGGFGDIGMQWSHVAVGGRVATSTNTLFIEPQQNKTGPITVANRKFGQQSSASAHPAQVATASRAASSQVAASALTSVIPATDTNSATNSGRITGSQFNDGGFGDVGLQWKKVRVGGAVTTVHNSLTVQPENKGQGLITVQGVQFPAVPPPTSRASAQPIHQLATNPPAVTTDGDPVAGLPTPTGPISSFFPTPIAGPGTITLPFPGNLPLVNAATNSGLIRGGQFNAGGFGDDGLQWLNVRVGGHVQVVHNSLSVHPEGSHLAGISVADVGYGAPVSHRVSRHLAVLPSAVITPGTGALVSALALKPGPVLSPPNDRSLSNQQLAATNGTDVFLQWNGIVRNRGLVLVHNIIKIMGVGPSTGPITLSNIRFPFQVPNLTPVVTTSAPATGTVRALAQDPVLLNSANNSGYLNHAQFNAGGFGNDGLQWRNVQVDGSVDVVHNTLAVDASADLPTGDVSGPITIANVSFNSGALRGSLSGRSTQTLAAPPAVYQRMSSLPVNLGKALPQDPAVINNAGNSGVLKAGQFAQGAANHVLLQWQGVQMRGPVKVIDNVLAISVLNRPSGPITISNVTFA